MQSDTDGLPPLRERVSQACDTCKQRKGEYFGLSQHQEPGTHIHIIQPYSNSIINSHINPTIVKCDGQTPCSYCKRRHRAHTCRFSPPVRRRRHSEKPRGISTSPSVVAPPSNRIRPATPTAALTTPTTPIPTTTLPRFTCRPP